MTQEIALDIIAKVRVSINGKTAHSFGLDQIQQPTSSRIKDPITDVSVKNPQAHIPADPSNNTGGERNANI